MKKLILSIILVLSALSLVVSACHYRNNLQRKSGHTHASAGDAYLQTCQAALIGVYACQWPDEYQGMDEDGAAYRESKDVAEDGDCQ